MDFAFAAAFAAGPDGPRELRADRPRTTPMNSSTSTVVRSLGQASAISVSG
ncbi:Uncharacterised protein [Mycobacteroides abscessus subsp. abscessus]|nr:Uncharacterised protein [Mycobacteroides abscessus subsp. abscessus]